MCRLNNDHHFSPRQSYLMAACIKTIKCFPSPATTIICGCVGWNLARNYHFLNHFTLLAQCLFHSFSFSVLSLSSLKDLEPPACSSFCFLSPYFFFIIIQQHFSVRANAFWTASFLPFQAGCHCCCLWAGCIYLGVIGVWMSEVMRCIHTWLLPSLRAWDRRSLAGLRLELYHTAVSSTQARMALSYPGGQTQSLGLIPQWGVCSLKWCVCTCACVHVLACVFMWVERGKKHCLVVCLCLSWVLVCLAACVCISDFPCVFASACISGWVGVQWSSRRTFGSHSPLPISNCP